MGVLGLWETLESVGHPIKIEGLEGKILGVDANIWLYKFIRGFREKDNATNIESHKLGLFNRIAKLLFYRIRPVFVFDGPAPVLKRRTLERRQNIRNKHLTKVQDSAMRILANQLKSQYPDADIDHLKITMPNLISNNLVAAEKLTDEDRDLFYLPETGKLKNDDSDSDDSEIIDLIDDRQYMTTEVDIDSKDFEHLPAETRYEILHDIKQARKRIRNPDRLPDDANSFSNFQLERLKARRTVQEKIEKCEKEICTNYTGELADGSSIQAFRVQSDARATILYRNNTYDPKAFEKIKQEEDDKAKDDENEEKKVAENITEISPSGSQQNAASNSTGWTRSQEINIKGLANRLKSYKPAEISDQLGVASPNLSSPNLSSPDPSSPDPKSPYLSSTDVSSPDSSQTELQSQNPNSSQHILPDESSPQTNAPVSTESELSKPEASVVEPTTVSDDDSTSEDEIFECPQPSTVTTKNTSTDAHHDSDISIIYDNNNRTITIDSEGDMTNRTEFIGDSSDSDSEEPADPTNATTSSSQPSGQILKSISNESTSAPISHPEIEFSSSEDESIVPDLTQTKTSSSNVVITQDSQQTDIAGPSSKGTSQNENIGSQTSRPASSQPVRPTTPTRANKVTNKIVEDAKELLRLFGIPYIDATGEAEAQCAKLEELKLTEGTITDDSDIWLFGSQNVYRYFFNDDKYVMQYKMRDIEFHVRMTRENLVCFAMLVGSDYTDGIMNVGPVTALEVLSEFPGEGIDPLVQFRDWHHEALKDMKAAKKDKKRRKLLKYRLPDEFPSRAVYDGYLRPVADTSAEKFTWGTPELDELREYARRNFGWDPKKVDDKLIPVMKRLNEKKIQKTIDTFFFKTQANRNPEMFRSKRVNQALNKIAKRAAREEKVPVPEVCNLSEDED